MNKKGFTLIELSFTLIIGAMLGLAIGTQYLAECNIRESICTTVSNSNEASAIIHHLGNTLKLLDPDTINTTSNGTYTQIFAATTNTATSSMPSGTAIMYGRKSTGVFEFKRGSLDPVVLSTNMTDFSISTETVSTTKKMFNVSLTFSINGRTFNITTKILNNPAII